MIFSDFRFRLWNRSPTGNDQSKRTIVFQVPLWSVHPGVVQEEGHVERLQDQDRQGGGQVTGTTQRSGVPLPKEESSAWWRQLVPGTKQDLQSSADSVESVQRRREKKPNLDEFRPGCGRCERVRPRKPRWYRKRDRFNKRRRWGGGRTTVWWQRTPPPPGGDGGHETGPGPGHSQIRGVWRCSWTWGETPEPATHNVLRLRGGSPHRCHCSQKVFGSGHPQILGVSGGHLRHTAPSRPWGHVFKSRDQIQSRGFGPGLRQCRRGIVIKAARALAALIMQFFCVQTLEFVQRLIDGSQFGGVWGVGGARRSDWLLWSSRTGGQEQFYRPQWLRLK